MSTIYELSYEWYEDYSPILFTHPTRHLGVDEWKSLCDSLVDRAASVILSRDDDMYVGWPEVHAGVAEMLVAEHGFVKMDTVKHRFWGSGILQADDGDDRGALSFEVFAEIVEKNNRVRAGARAFRIKGGAA